MFLHRMQWARLRSLTGQAPLGSERWLVAAKQCAASAMRALRLGLVQGAIRLKPCTTATGNARSSVESNDSRVTPLYDAFLLLTTAALDGFRVFNSSMRTGISL